MSAHYYRVPVTDAAGVERELVVRVREDETIELRVDGLVETFITVTKSDTEDLGVLLLSLARFGGPASSRADDTEFHRRGAVGGAHTGRGQSGGGGESSGVYISKRTDP